MQYSFYSLYITMIEIIKTSKWLRQCKYKWLVVWELETKEDAISFCKNQDYCTMVRIWDWSDMEEIVL